MRIAFATLAAIAALILVPTAEALPRFRITVPLPRTALPSAAELSGNREALAARKSLLRLNVERARALNSCFTRAVTGAAGGAYGVATDSDSLPGVTGAINKCFDAHLPSQNLYEARETVADQIIDGVNNGQRDIRIDWAEAASVEPASAAGVPPSGGDTSPSYTNYGVGLNPLIPIGAVAGGLGLLAIVVVRRRA
jgi:hypothetical protein